MAQFTRIEVALKMKESGIIPVFYHPDAEICKSVVRACYEGGLRLFEFTNRGDFAHEIFSDLNKFAIRELPGMILGAGSINDAGTTSLYIQLGANFIVSPVIKEEMALICNRRKILWSPGCGSLTEISRAEELGAEVVKIFPAPSVGGPEFVKTVKGPQPWTSIMPTGGVEPTEESLRTWFEAGVHCVGMGSNLVSKDILKDKDWNKLKTRVSELVSILKTIRNKN
ncbi:MAG: bifunctional 4-hydroxy-2-oxoglutarate aldolase/2-dehydro-3-deoxy-phosphogluconate aldolase [Bacteroidales bacterium]|nr:bifunctional 4-hydroxy-2-oxoglutarate aldolase/2-dehydro-3-deoxy-phosphogluconate aldolase [Bacteroidales bacterium]MCB8999065.1 bifunctional 4-hydroxy-2-oxoglutarate aldolase/2-dehydro-3-deoxy-phosphogluconate aldolase [Bacteroidales bacterium]